jgi:predicted transcriptional regulator of viral defense system
MKIMHPLPSALLSRIRSEYQEMPGLCLTRQQACRLWQIETHLCEALLARLTAEGFLARLPSGTYVCAAASNPSARVATRRASASA